MTVITPAGRISPLLTPSSNGYGPAVSPAHMAGGKPAPSVGPLVEIFGPDEPKISVVLKWALVLACLSVASLVDYTMIKSLLLHLLRSEGVGVATQVAAGVTALSVIAMLVSGREAKLRKIHRERPPIDIWLTAAWLLLGIGLVVLRWWGADLFAGNGAGPQFEGRVLPNTGNDVAREHAVAGLMFGTYMLTGALAYAEATTMTNPAASGLRRVRRQLQQLTKSKAASDARLARHLTNLGAAEAQIAAVDTDAENMLTVALPGLAREAKAYARMTIARAISTPRGADIVHQPAAAAHGPVPDAETPR